MLVVNNIPASQAVVEDLQYASSTTKHYFSRLYKCSSCNWWAVREAWENYVERGYDYLIVGRVDGYEVKDRQLLPWIQAVENKHVYSIAMPIPDLLSKLFVNDKSKKLTVFKPGEKVRLVDNVTIYQPTLCFWGTKGSSGTIASYNEYHMAYEQLKIRLTRERSIDPATIKFKFMETDLDLRREVYYAVRLDKLESSPIDRLQGEVCKEGEIYLVEPLDLEKVD